MPIPDYQTIMLPLLKFTADQKEHQVREAIEYLSQEFKLTEEEKRTRLASGPGLLFNDRVSWANVYIRKAGLLESTKRGFIKITKRGLEVLKQNPKEVNNEFLRQYSEFVEWTKATATPTKTSATTDTKIIAEKSPTEDIESGYQRIRETLAQELLSQIKKCSPDFLEKLVIKLLIVMGYGGTMEDAGQVLGKTGDGGIDGLIKEDKLGLDVIYVQAKRWDNTVGSPEIRNFIGALNLKNAHKGIFITTSSFSASALNDTKNVAVKIVTIDGHQLAELMIDYDVGVSKYRSYDVKKIDIDFFEET